MDWGTFFQTSLGLWSFLSGMFLCLTYDFFRAFRLKRKPCRLRLFISDFVFCLISTTVMLVVSFNFSYGRLRVYSVVLALMGFLLWRYTVGKLFVALIGRAIDFLAGLGNRIKLYCKAVSIKIIKTIRTKNYCRRMVKKSKAGFGIITERDKK